MHFKHLQAISLYLMGNALQAIHWIRNVLRDICNFWFDGKYIWGQREIDLHHLFTIGPCGPLREKMSNMPCLSAFRVPVTKYCHFQSAIYLINTYKSVIWLYSTLQPKAMVDKRDKLCTKFAKKTIQSIQNES